MRLERGVAFLKRGEYMVDHPAIDLGHQVMPLSGGHEMVRRPDRALLIRQAQQEFGAAREVWCQRRHGLYIQ